ncbi:MAG: CBS domain-containing protein [Kiritimatiellae bacterium]|nr:CBS domain-containing protein [Kiritimatiellia bacterium]
MNVTVGELLTGKGREVWSVGIDATLGEALQLMSEKNIGAVLVLEEGRVAGIFSERDYARHAVRHRMTPSAPVRELMTSDVFYITPGKTLDECMALMTSKHIRHLPVMDGKKLMGLVSIGDVVKKVISEQEFKIQELENYIKAL